MAETPPPLPLAAAFASREPVPTSLAKAIEGGRVAWQFISDLAGRLGAKING